MKLMLNNKPYTKASLFSYLKSNEFEKNKVEDLYRTYSSERDNNEVQNSDIIIKEDMEKLLAKTENLLEEVKMLLR